MYEYPEDVKPATARAAKPAPKHDLFARVVRVFRWLLIPYVFAILLGGFLTIALAGYGLAHGSTESNNRFFMQVGLGLLALGLPPFTLLFNSRAVWLRALQVIGMIVLCVGVFHASRLVFHVFIEPKMLASRLDAVVKPITIESVEEEPYLNAATGTEPIGLRVRASVRLPREVPLDQFGVVVLGALEQSIQIAALEAKGNNRSGPVERVAGASVSFNGQPLDALPGMKAHRARSYGAPADGTVTLPAGSYQITQDYWLQGLRRPHPNDWKDTNPTPCKVDNSAQKLEFQQYAEDHLIAVSNSPLSVSIGERMSLGGRRGYHGFNRAAPLKYRFNYEAWKVTLASLPLASCDAADAERKAKQDATEALKKTEDDKRSYDNGSIAFQQNPLYAEACAGDVDKIKARIEAEKSPDGVWLPRFALSGIMVECSMNKPNPAVFKLLAPALYARAARELGESRAEVCSVLEQLHAYRRLSHLAALAELGLALDCEDRQLWRHGLAPETEGVPRSYDRSYDGKKMKDSAARSDNVIWVKFLLQNKINICEPGSHYSMAGTKMGDAPTLLTLITPHYGADMIEAVRDAGCDPHVPPPVTPNTAHTQNPAERYSSAVVWLLRRHRFGGDGTTAPLATDNAARLTKLDRLMMPTAAELNDVRGPSTAPLLRILSRTVVESPPSMLKALLAAGAAPNAALEPGKTWFGPLHGQPIRDEQNQELAIALMAVLSDAELKAIINSPGPSIEDAAKTIVGLRRKDDPAGGGVPTIRDYVCKRKVLVCP